MKNKNSKQKNKRMNSLAVTLIERCKEVMRK